MPLRTDRFVGQRTSSRTSLGANESNVIWRNARLPSSHDHIRDGAEIYRRSFAIIRREADLARFGSDEERVAVRIIHALAAWSRSQATCSSSPAGAAGAAAAAIERGAPILCDAKMVAHGVTRSRLPTSNPVICTLDDVRVPDPCGGSALERHGQPRPMELWLRSYRRRRRGDRYADGAVSPVRNAR